MVAIDHTSCGPCANVMCSQYGCQRERARQVSPYRYYPEFIAQRGCICPPTSEQTCMSATCPRRLPRT